MLEIILMAVVGSASLNPSYAQIQTCQWPNKCAKKAVVVAQIQTCQWPNRCATPGPKALPKGPEGRLPNAAAPDVKTCEYPNRCS